MAGGTASKAGCRIARMGWGPGTRQGRHPGCWNQEGDPPASTRRVAVGMDLLAEATNALVQRRNHLLS